MELQYKAGIYEILESVTESNDVTCKNCLMFPPENVTIEVSFVWHD